MSEKPKLDKLFRDDPQTKEGKYLVKRRDGTVVEWPSFVLGARDPHAVPALLAYAESISKDPDCHPDFPGRIRRMAELDYPQYREAFGTGDPTRGRHRVDDPATIAEMRGEPDPLLVELRMGLESLARLGAGDQYGNSIGNTMARDLLRKVQARLDKLSKVAGENKSS